MSDQNEQHKVSTCSSFIIVNITNRHIIINILSISYLQCQALRSRWLASASAQGCSVGADAAAATTAARILKASEGGYQGGQRSVVLCVAGHHAALDPLAAALGGLE